MKRQNVRTLALIVVTFTYLLVGAAVFDALESADEETEKSKMETSQDEFMKKYNISSADFEKIFILVLRMKPIKSKTQWKFAGAFYFATTVITTIGYGHSTPKTPGGKIFCMLYALPGIPLTIVMFQSIGERMNIFITCMLQLLQTKITRKSSKISQTKLILISFNFVSLVIIIGSVFFMHSESWSFFNSIYYCFITLTTIGFGDLVALQKDDKIAKRPDYVAFNLIFILVGLTVVSSVMNLLVLRFLTMNTEDECRDEIQAAVQAIDQNRDYSNRAIYRSNELLSLSKIQCNSYTNPAMSEVSSNSNCSCLCLQAKNARHWTTSWKSIDNQKRCIFTRSFVRKNEEDSNKFGVKSAIRIPVQWTVDSYHRNFGGHKKHYTVKRDPAVVRHLAESGFTRHYQCFPPTIKVDKISSNPFTDNYAHNFKKDSSSLNLCEIEIASGNSKNFLNENAESHRRRNNTL